MRDLLIQMFCWALILGVCAVGVAYAAMLNEVLTGHGRLTAAAMTVALAVVLPAGAIQQARLRSRRSE